MKNKQTFLLPIGILTLAGFALLFLVDSSLASSTEGRSVVGSPDGEGNVIRKLYQPIMIKPAGHGSPSPTAIPTAVPTIVPTADPTAVPTSHPNPSGNLLVNPKFLDGFVGWESSKGYWDVHPEIPCGPVTQYAQMDIDVGGGWPEFGEDWLTQDVVVQQQHTSVKFEMVEGHHMYDGVAELTIYGSSNMGQTWEVVFHRPGVVAPFGSGKCGEGLPPIKFTYNFPGGYGMYRLEIHGKINNPYPTNDGFLWGGFYLGVE